LLAFSFPCISCRKPSPGPTCIPACCATDCSCQSLPDLFKTLLNSCRHPVPLSFPAGVSAQPCVADRVCSHPRSSCSSRPGSSTPHPRSCPASIHR
jgi:hypothetical protein